MPLSVERLGGLVVDRPHKSLGLSVGSALLAAMVAAFLSLMYAAQRQPFGGQRVALHAMALALLAAIAWIVLRIVRLAALCYAIDDGYLCVDMGLARWRVPLGNVRQITQPKGTPAIRWGWPGWNHAIVRPNPDSLAYAASTLPERRSLLLQGQGWSLLISPRNPTAFVHAFDQARRTRRPVGPVTREPLGLASWPIWRDHTMLYPMIIGVVSTLLLYTSAARVYPTLSRQITAIGTGAATRMLVPQDAAKAIPAVASLVASINMVLAVLLHRQDRILARLLTYGLLVQQAILWISLWQLVKG